MMKLILLAATYLLIGFSNAQVAPVLVTVTDANEQPISSDKILFIGMKSGKSVSGITDAKGQFNIELPAGETYEIKIDAMGDEMEYSSLEVPTLPEGSEFQDMEIQIMYEMASSITLDDLHFATGKSMISANSYSGLNDLTDYLKRKKDIRILIGGHTDNVGDPVANLKLSEARALAVKDYLIKKGISTTRLISKGYGEARPIADNSSSEGRSTNRRTEIEIIE